MKKSIVLGIGLAVAAMSYSLVSCNKTEKPQESTQAEIDLSKLPEADQKLIKQANQVFGILPDSANNPKNPLTAEKIELGRALYFDARLSKSGVISCNSCHNVAHYGVDNLPTSPGHK
ncbi:MAG: cytochrome c peroxidase, partial [Bacteroidota bacterium]